MEIAADHLTRTLSKEPGSRKIRVHAVNPGPVETEGTRAAGFVSHFAAFAAFAVLTPLGRVGRPEDIAPGVVVLASGEAGWIIGETLIVSGGLRREAIHFALTRINLNLHAPSSCPTTTNSTPPRTAPWCSSTTNRR